MEDYEKLYLRDGYLGKRKKHCEPLPECTCYDGECPYSDYCTNRDIGYCILDDMRGDDYDND